MRHPADSPEAELAGDFLAMAAERRQERDAALAEVAALRAIIEGRTTPPTDAEIDAHADAGGAWLVTLPAIRQVRSKPETRYTADPREVSRLWWSEGARWVAVLDGKPCAWPVVSR